MKPVIITLLAAVSIQAQSVAWSLQSQTTPWLANGGYEHGNTYDSQSGQIIVHVLKTFIGTVSVTNGSPTMNWVSGDKFSRVWHESVTGHANQLTVNGTTNVSMTGPPTSCTAGVAISCTQLTMTSNWAGTTGTYSYLAYSQSIYSDSFAAYNAATDQYTFINGWGSMDNQCLTDSSTYHLPEARQPSMMSIDTKRHYFYMGGGVNNSCTNSVTTNGTSAVVAASGQLFTQAGLWNGLNVTFFGGGTAGSGCTITSVADALHMTVACSVYPNGATAVQVLPPERQYPSNLSGVFDWGYWTLNADPTTDTWTQLPTSAIATFTANNVALYVNSTTYDAASDVTLAFGSLYGTNTFVICSTDGNPGGTLTAAQTTAGCVSANVFAQVTGLASTPPGVYWPGLIYDANCGCDWAYGGANTFGNAVATQTDIWKYVAASKLWTQMNTTSQPAATSITVQPPELVLNTAAHTLHLHVPDAAAGPTAKDYRITPGPSAAWSIDTTSGASIPACSFTQFGNCGTTGIFTNYDPNTGRIVGIMQSNGGSPGPSAVNVWQGALPVAPVITSGSTLTTGTQNSAYVGWTFTATGTTPITWSITSGSLPTGMFINSGTGSVTGTPSNSGTFNFTVQAANGVSPNATQNASLLINPVCLITSSTLASGKLGVAYSQTIPTAGCVSPTFSVTTGATNLAAFGLAVSSGGVVSGTPIATGLCSFTVGVTDAQGNPTQAYGITFVAGPGSISVPFGGKMTVR